MPPKNNSTPKYIADLFECIQGLKDELKAQKDSSSDQISKISDHLVSLDNQIQERLQVPQAASQVSMSPVTLLPNFLYPKPNKNREKEKIMALLTQVFPGKDDDDLVSMYDKIGKFVLRTCKSYARDKSNVGKKYGKVSDADKSALVEQVASKLIANSQDFQFLSQCEDIWPVEFKVSMCWSNKAKYVRKTLKANRYICN